MDKRTYNAFLKMLRPLPEYIAERIRKRDAKLYPTPYPYVRFYSYLSVKRRKNKELVKTTVAVKHYRKKLYMKTVAVHFLHGDTCFVKDMEYCSYTSMGFRVGWYDQGISKYRHWYEERGWCWAKDRYYDPFAPILNPEVIDRLPQYKYSAYRQFGQHKLFEYLRIYEKYPQAELFVKFGLSSYVLSKQIMARSAWDKSFRKWLIRNRLELSSSPHYISTVLLSYKTGKSLRDTQLLEEQKKSFCNGNGRYPELRKFFKGRTTKFLEYVNDQETGISDYNDYYTACLFLGLDMSLDKNVFPHDFKHWHDIRIDEYATKKALLDEKKRKELYDKFRSVAEKYVALQQYNSNDKYVIVIAKSPAELIREGEVLHHCVGRMNYDQKFVREESLIFFVRQTDSPDVPFVTLEYSLSGKKILQCYGEHDGKPDDHVLEYVNNAWLPYANRTVKKLFKKAA